MKKKGRLETTALNSSYIIFYGEIALLSASVIGRGGLDRRAASTSQMGRFEIEWLTSEANLTTLADLFSAG